MRIALSAIVLIGTLFSTHNSYASTTIHTIRCRTTTPVAHLARPAACVR